MKKLRSLLILSSSLLFSCAPVGATTFKTLLTAGVTLSTLLMEHGKGQAVSFSDEPWGTVDENFYSLETGFRGFVAAGYTGEEVLGGGCIDDFGQDLIIADNDGFFVVGYSDDSEAS